MLNADVAISHSWAGIMGFTGDRDPFVGGVPGAPGQFVAAGFSGHGMPRCHPAAHLLAAQVAVYLAYGITAAVDTQEANKTNVPTQPSHALLQELNISSVELARMQQAAAKL